LVWVVGYVAITVSVVLAVRFAYASADTTIDALIRSGAAAVAAVVGCHGPAWILRSVRMRALSGAILASLGFSICLVVTLAGGIGTIAAGSDKSFALRANASASYADRRAELESLRAKRAALPANRPAGTVESDMAAARVDRRWASSNACAEATTTASRTFCADYARLEGELAAAKEAASLQTKIHELTERLGSAPGVRAINPQAAVIGRLLHIAPEDAEAWYALLFALAVETAAMSVLLLAEGTTQYRTNSEVPTVTLEPVRSPHGGKGRAIIDGYGRVVDWMRDRAIPARQNGEIHLDALHADYERWCANKALQAMPQRKFARRFDDLREGLDITGTIKKSGDRYYGIALADTTIGRLAISKRT
jgi:hypothetical protein